MEDNTVNNKKTRITIYNISAPNAWANAYSVILSMKMNKYAKLNNMNVQTASRSLSFIDGTGEDSGNKSDIILLSPEYRVLEKEIKQKFPNKIIKLLTIEDYGKLKAEKILKMALSLQNSNH